MWNPKYVILVLMLVKTMNNCDSEDVVEADTISTLSPVKRRRLHMTCGEIEELEKTSDGVKALTNPVLVNRGKTINKHLEPKQPRKTGDVGFQKASCIVNPILEFQRSPPKGKSQRSVMRSPIKKAEGQCKIILQLFRATVTSLSSCMCVNLY